MADTFKPILDIRRLLNQAKVKKSSEVQISQDLTVLPEEMAEIWQVAQVEVDHNLTNPVLELTLNNDRVLVNFRESLLHLCPRCRLFRSTEENKICQRCQSVTETIQ